jgi:hypothetical protein
MSYKPNPFALYEPTAVGRSKYVPFVVVPYE